MSKNCLRKEKSSDGCVFFEMKNFSFFLLRDFVSHHNKTKTDGVVVVEVVAQK